MEVIITLAMLFKYTLYTKYHSVGWIWPVLNTDLT